MRRLWLVAGLFFTLALTGCPSLDRQTFEALDESWSLLKPYALTGIAVDTTLDPASRAIRNRQVEEFSKLLAEGLKNAE
jgi:hypothetical protein